ncbi:hypothetical protein OUZ56_013686 [Daphnia magna]|uniref:Uncharacterized protein n=1 Tax=Daphnia magna TaxID=35525 RepID=A0ABQ9Z6M0_9CRUS|nr:hypothetical protein OUZ56_013686 [Daphnia magna]
MPVVSKAKKNLTEPLRLSQFVNWQQCMNRKDLNAVRQNMTTTPDRVQVPGHNLQQEIGSSIRFTSATCLSHSVATPTLSGKNIKPPSQYYLIN